MTGILAVVDDDAEILRLLRVQLELDGFTVREFGDGEGFLDFLQTTVPALLILDLSLPRMGGLDVLRTLKRNEHMASLPIIILSGSGTETDRIIGLELGADDYVVKPFSPKELSARVRAVLRRVQARENVETIVLGDLEMDRNRFEARFKGRKLDLTTSEFKILATLAKRPGWVFSRSQLLEQLYPDQTIVVERTIDVHIRHLREKLDVGGNLITTVRGVGYKLERREV